MTVAGVAFERAMSEIRSPSNWLRPPGRTESDMVCLVPQHEAARVRPASREGFVRTDFSRLHRLRRDLAFAVSDRIHVWIHAPDDVEAANPGYTHPGLPTNYVPGARRQATPPVGQQAKPAQHLATTKEL